MITVLAFLLLALPVFGLSMILIAKKDDRIESTVESEKNTSGKLAA